MSAGRWSLGEFGIRVKTQDYLKIHEQEAVRKAGTPLAGWRFRRTARHNQIPNSSAPSRAHH